MNRPLAISMALALLSSACAAPPVADLESPDVGVELEAPTLGTIADFGAAIDLLVQGRGAFPDTPEWSGALVIYRRGGERWHLEATIDLPADHLAAATVHVLASRIFVVTPNDNQCRDPSGAVVAARSGAVYVYEDEAENGRWAQTARVCPPEGWSQLGRAATRDQTLIVEAIAEDGSASILARVEDVAETFDLAEQTRVAAVPNPQLASDGDRVVRQSYVQDGWLAEVHPSARLEEVEQSVVLPDRTGMRMIALAPSGILSAVQSTFTRTRPDGGTDEFDLVGANLVQQLDSTRDLAEVVGQGGLYLVPFEQPPHPVAPSLEALCESGIMSVALSETHVALACRGTYRPWIIPR